MKFLKIVLGLSFGLVLLTAYAEIVPYTTATKTPLFTHDVVPIFSQLPTTPTVLLTPELLEERRHSLQEKQQSLQSYREAMQKNKNGFAEKINALKNEEITQELLDKASLNKDDAAIEIENSNLELQTSETTLKELRNVLNSQEENLDILNKTPVTPNSAEEKQKLLIELENNIYLQKMAIVLEEKNQAILKERANVIRERLELAAREYIELQRLYQTQQKQQSENNRYKQQQSHLAKAAELRERMQNLKSENLTVAEQSIKRRLLLVQIRSEDELAQLVLHRLKIESIQMQLEQAKAIAEQQTIQAKLGGQQPLNHISNVSNDMLTQVQGLVEELVIFGNMLKNKIKVLEQQREIVQKRAEASEGSELKVNKQAEKILADLITEFQKELDNLPDGKEVLITLEKAYKEGLQRALLQTRDLPDTSAQWYDLLLEISTLPALFSQQLQATLLNFKQNMEQASLQRWSFISVSIIIWLATFIWIRLRLTQIFTTLDSAAEHSFAVRGLLISLHLLRMNIWGILITGIFLLLIWFIQPTQSSFILTITLLFFWLGVKVPINLAWLLLSSRSLVKTHHRSKLYQQLRWSIILMGIFAGITALGHVLHSIVTSSNQPLLSITARDLIDSIFMLFLSLTLFPVMHIRHLTLNFLGHGVKGYWFLVISLISLLFPLSLLSVAVLGVIGYINLGWYVAEHLSWFLLVFTGWLVVRGLFDDTIVFLKGFSLRHSNHALLWTQDIIPLFDRLLRIALVILAVLTFFWLNGWYRDTAVIDNLMQFYQYPLFSYEDKDIQVANILWSMFTLWAVFWLGSWIQQITYRWIYSAITDLGARHSLSVFTQYAVVFIGLLITLRVIGINLTTLTVFAGALGVGIGFGLQNIANNFVSGILLLAERPLRTGDLISIGSTQEAVVTKIGIRSLTVKTQDHQEVIIPNSDLISNAFTNWTYSNHLLRTTLYVGISYDDDPHMAMEQLNKALSEFPEVLRDHPYEIFLWEFANSSINFRINYYINLRETDRFVMRSRVLLKVWDYFKEAGITIPYAQQDIFIKNLPPHLFPLPPKVNEEKA